MTTLEPGASDVLTHGLDCSPRSTALRASRPAPIITDGFDVFVHDVIAAITTWPWSSSVSVPSASVSGTISETRSATCAPPVPAPAGSGWRSCDGVAVRGRRVGGRERLLGLLVGLGVGGSTRSSSAIRNEALDSVSETRSCGRFGPASDGTTSPRSSSSVSE